ncbi:MAG: lipopolysaccharide biosynthesis protein [Woeseiaceae bacterium]
MESLTKKTALGAAWMMFSKLAIRFIGLISTLILVRLLSPEDFGIAAMAMTVVAMVELLTTFGFDIAIIQNQNANDDDYNTAWTMNVILGLSAATLLMLLAYPAAQFYERPELVPIYFVLSLATIFQGLQNIGLVDFRKNLTFEKEFAFLVSVKMAAFVITLTIAFLLRSYWALVIGIVVSRFAATCLSYWAHPFRPRFSLAALDRIMNFSKWLFLNNMVNMFRQVGPELVIGRISGARGLGLFRIAYEISNLPTTELIAPANRALLPGFSKISHDMERAGRQFLRIAGILSLLSLPTGFGIAVTASLFTPIVLGDGWLSTIPLIQVLAIFGAISAIQSPIATVLIAIGKPKYVSLMSLAQLFVMMPLLVYMNMKAGVLGAAIALLLTACLSMPVYFILAARQLNIRLGAFVRVICNPLLATLVMYMAVTQMLPKLDANILDLTLASASGALVYIAGVLILWLATGRRKDSAEYEILTVGLGLAQKARKKLLRSSPE